MESYGSYEDIEDFLFVLDQNVPSIASSSNNLSTFSTEVTKAGASTVCLHDVSTFEQNASKVSNPQTGRKRSRTDQQTEETSRRKYKKFQHLPEDIAEFKRQKVNKMERDRQGNLTQDIKNLKPLILKQLDLPGHEADSKYSILKSSIYTIQQLYQEISTLRKMIGSDDEMKSSGSEHQQSRVLVPTNGPVGSTMANEDPTNSLHLPGNVNHPLNLIDLEATKCMPISESPMVVPDQEMTTLNQEHSEFLQDWMEPIKNFTESDVTMREEFGTILQDSALKNNGAYDAPVNGVHSGAYNAPVNVAYNAPVNGVHNKVYNAPVYGGQIGAYSSSVSGVHNGAYNAPVNGVHNGAYNAPVNGVHNGAYNAPVNGVHNGAYNAPVNGVHNGAYNAPVNRVYNGAYNAPVNGFHNGAYRASVIVCNVADTKNVYSTSLTTEQSESDIGVWSPSVDTPCSTEPGLNIASPTPSEETPTTSGILFDDDAYVPSFFDLLD